MMRDIPELLQGLSLSPGILKAFVESIPQDKLDLRRGEGFWTIAEHVSHLAGVQQMLLGRFQRFIKEDHPVFVPYIPGKNEEEPDTPPAMEMSGYRNDQLSLLQKADERVWQRTAEHPEYDLYSLYILARHTLIHDHWHMYRMEELWLTKDAYLTKLA